MKTIGLTGKRGGHSLVDDDIFELIAGKSFWINLGRHKTQEDAARAYNDAAKIYFGEFALLNPV